MGFSLTIQEGKDLGRQYAFDQPEVSIGRTAENDVVLYDPGVSRRHAVIRAEGAGFVVQDQGSANGTQVNGNPVNEEALQTGDLVSVGPVVFAFEVQEAANSTRIVDTAELEKQRAARKALAKSTSAQLQATGRIPASKRPPALARVEKAGPPAPRARPKAAAAAPMLASERARLRRQNAGPIGKLKIFFIEAPKPVRLGIMGAGGALALLLLVLLVVRIANPKAKASGILDQSRKAFALTERSTKDVYGYGPELEVSVQTRDELHFEFDYAESIPTAYYIKFEALGIERKDEVELSLNGVHIGYANPGIGDFTKAQRIRLPKKHLKRGIKNEVVFDNTANPPAEHSWAIRKVRLDIKPLPQCAPDECRSEARKLLELADLRVAQKGIAARNLFDAWTFLHGAQMFIEAIDPRPEDLYGLAQSTLRDVDRELEDKCNKTMLAAKKFEELGDLKQALKEYKDGMQWFPQHEDEHPCRGRLQEKIDEYGDSGPGR